MLFSYSVVPSSELGQSSCRVTTIIDMFLFELMLCIPVNNFLVILGCFLGLTSSKHLAQGHNTVLPATSQFQAGSA